ncbi:hypothetical protein SBA3_3770003 [Candidatus Sulfopaludibacter sp. SbA3]|nr:hypothetical protein SBA3_3770003 [Candidatus Sulfopaludibacter sp. SbA3]
MDNSTVSIMTGWLRFGQRLWDEAGRSWDGESDNAIGAASPAARSSELQVGDFRGAHQAGMGTAKATP